MAENAIRSMLVVSNAVDACVPAPLPVVLLAAGVVPGVTCRLTVLPALPPLLLLLVLLLLLAAAAAVLL